MGSVSNGGLRMSDGMSDRTSRSASGRIPRPVLSGWDIRDRGAVHAERALSKRVRRAYVRVVEYTREQGCDGTTVRSDLRSSRARASKPTRYVLALERIRAHGYGDDRIREHSPVCTGYTDLYNSCRLLETPLGSSSTEEPQWQVLIISSFGYRRDIPRCSFDDFYWTSKSKMSNSNRNILCNKIVMYSVMYIYRFKQFYRLL